MADAFDDLIESVRKAPGQAAQAMKPLSGLVPTQPPPVSRWWDAAKSAASQGWSQLQQTPGNVGTLKESLRGVGVESTPIDRWDIGSALNSAKSRLVGLWRGYVVPALR